MRRISHILLTRTLRFWFEAGIESSVKVHYITPHVAQPFGLGDMRHKNEEISTQISTITVLTI